MSVFAIALMEISNKDTLAAYREGAAAALAKHGGRVVKATPAPAVIEAPDRGPDTAALLEFPSEAAARAWREDTELADLHGLRTSAGASTIVILPADLKEA